MKVSKRVESAAHIGMGFFAAFLFIGLLLHYRERWQLPPENDAHPVIWLISRILTYEVGFDDTDGGEEYWAKVRVMDMMNDSREYWIGYTAGHMAQTVLVGIFI